MNQTDFLRWLNQIYATGANEFSCDQLQAILAEYVDHEVAGHDPASHLPQAAAHLNLCPDCREEYAGLLAVARLEARGQLPTVEAAAQEFPAEAAPAAEAAPQPDHPEKVPA